MCLCGRGVLPPFVHDEAGTLLTAHITELASSWIVQCRELNREKSNKKKKSTLNDIKKKNHYNKELFSTASVNYLEILNTVCFHFASLHYPQCLLLVVSQRLRSSLHHYLKRAERCSGALVLSISHNFSSVCPAQTFRLIHLNVQGILGLMNISFK